MAVPNLTTFRPRKGVTDHVISRASSALQGGSRVRLPRLLGSPTRISIPVTSVCAVLNSTTDRDGWTYNSNAE